MLEGLRVKRERRDVDELDRGAAAGMTIPDLRMDDLENLGALTAKSGVGSEVDGAGMGTESVHRPLSLAAAVGCELLERSDEVDMLANMEVGRDACSRGAECQSPLTGLGRIAVRSRLIKV